MNRTSVLLAALVVLLAVGPLVAGGLSHRAAAPTPGVAVAAKASAIPISRAALGAPVMKVPAGPLARQQSTDSLFKRTVRTVIGVDARGGSLSGNVGSFMARNETSEFAARRTQQRWQNASGYAVNAGRAARRLWTALGDN